MNISKVLFIITLIAVLFTTLLPNITLEKGSGKISKVDYSSGKISIKLKNISEELVVFDNKILSLNENDLIYYVGKKEKYKKEDQIIIYQIKK